MVKELTIFILGKSLHLHQSAPFLPTSLNRGVDIWRLLLILRSQDFFTVCSSVKDSVNISYNQQDTQTRADEKAFPEEEVEHRGLLGQ